MGAYLIRDAWSEFFNPFDCGAIDSSIAFVGGAGRGAVNDVVGVGQAVQQTALQATDTVRVVTGTDHGKFLSQTGQAIQSGQLSAGQYYRDTAISTVTVGISNQIEAVAEYREGKISYEEMNKRIGTTAIFQAGAAYGLSKTKVGNLPIQQVPGYLARSLGQLRVGAASGPNFRAVAQNGLDLSDPALARMMANSGPVVFKVPLGGATAAELLQIREYVAGCNEAQLGKRPPRAFLTGGVDCGGR